MSQNADREVLWVRFPKGEARLCAMTLPDQRSGLLLLHRNDEAGRGVLERARRIGFRVGNLRSGGTAAIMVRGPEGYPFKTRALAQALGGVAVPVPISVIQSESFPRPAPLAQTEVSSDAAPEGPRAAAQGAEGGERVSDEEERKKRVEADASVADEVASILADADLLLDEVQAEPAEQLELT